MLPLVAAGLLLSWVLCTAVLIGLGSLVLDRFVDSCRLLDGFWMGLAIAVAFLEVWSLLRPITPTAALLLVAAGVSGLAWHRKGISRRSAKAIRGVGWPVLVYAPIVGFIAVRSCGPCDYYDTGLYGAPAIRWIVSYAAVPGLANLHERFGFNSSVFLCDAVLDQRIWPSLYFHFFTGLMLAAMWAAIFPSVVRVVRGAPTSVADYFQALLTIPAASWAARSKIVGTITDQPSAIVCLVAAGILFSELSRGAENRDEPGGGQVRIVFAATLAALGLTFKLSAIVFSVLAWAVAFAWLRSSSKQSNQRGVWLAACILLPAAILVPWLIRGVILSGYPFYPSAALGIPADWHLPAGLANREAHVIHSFSLNQVYAHTPAKMMAWGRLGAAGRWFFGVVRIREAFQAPFLISIVGGAALFACSFRAAQQNANLNRPLWLLVPSIGGIVFWLIKAPDPRFGEAALWALAATLGALGMASSTMRFQWVRPRVVAAGLLAATLWCLSGVGWLQPYRPLWSIHGLTPLPVARVATRSTTSGLLVFVPVSGDQCWDEPLPCTPYFDSTLRMRSPGNLGQGFESEGLQNSPID
jgi:hypothetical protein